MHLLAGLALLGLDRVEESVQAFGDVVAAADALLDLADRNVDALQAPRARPEWARGGHRRPKPGRGVRQRSRPPAR